MVTKDILLKFIYIIIPIKLKRKKKKFKIFTRIEHKHLSDLGLTHPISLIHSFI